MQSTQRIRRSDDQWADLFAQFDASGLPATTFCQQKGIAYGTFTRRRRRLAAGGTKPATPQATTADWLPIEFASHGNDRGGAGDGTTAASWDVELDLPGGVQLRLRTRA